MSILYCSRFGTPETDVVPPVSPIAWAETGVVCSLVLDRTMSFELEMSITISFVLCGDLEPIYNELPAWCSSPAP